MYLLFLAVGGIHERTNLCRKGKTLFIMRAIRGQTQRTTLRPDDRGVKDPPWATLQVGDNEFPDGRQARWKVRGLRVNNGA